MTAQLLLIDVPATGTRESKAKAKDLTINRVNREMAKRRYYLHKHLDSEFVLNVVTRVIQAAYKSFEDIPVGQRYYIGQLMKLGYKVQYDLFIKNRIMHSTHQEKLLDAGFTIYMGTTVGNNKLVIKAKTPADHNWHIIEKDFKSGAEMKRRLQELDKMPKMIDLYDTKNSIKINE